MEYLYDLNKNEVVSHLSLWLSSADKELVYTAVLCIGNMARTDKHSTDIVTREVNKPLMNILKDETNNIKMQYAVLSTIRFVQHILDMNFWKTLLLLITIIIIFF